MLGDKTMADLFKNILDRLKLMEDDEDYDDYVNEEEEKEIRRVQKQEKKTINRQAATDAQNRYEESTPTQFTEVKREKAARPERPSAQKVVPIRTTKGFEVCIMKPVTFEDSQDICDMLLSGRAAVINLEGFDVELAQRIMDFISGAVYALNGKLHQISSYIFIISPDSVDISGDYLDLIEQDGFEVPTLNKEF